MSASVRDITALLDAEKDWREGLMRGNPDNPNSRPRPTLANALLALRTCPEWRGVLRSNVFSGKVEARSVTPWGFHGVWDDRQDALVCDWLQRSGIEIGESVAASAVRTAAGDSAFHPVQEWLRSLEWDGVPRLGSWLAVYLGVEPSPYASAVGGCTLIGAVARAMRPGVKADAMLILEGLQGSGKSRTCEILSNGWFTDEIADLGSKDCAMQLRGVWLVEIGELGAMKKAEIDTLKLFMSRRMDRYRPPYGRAVIDQPRNCFFIGTVNGDSYLRDESGARRFWPVACGKLDLEGLESARDQLYAEALYLFENGAQWWLEGEVLEEAEGEQDARYDADVWAERISRWIEGREEVYIDEVLLGAIDKAPSQWTDTDKKRVARVLQFLRWRRRYRGPRGARRWVYIPPGGDK